MYSDVRQTDGPNSSIRPTRTHTHTLIQTQQLVNPTPDFHFWGLFYPKNIFIFCPIVFVPHNTHLCELVELVHSSFNVMFLTVVYYCISISFRFTHSLKWGGPNIALCVCPAGSTLLGRIQLCNYRDCCKWRVPILWSVFFYFFLKCSKSQFATICPLWLLF